MLARVTSAAMAGIEARFVRVEVDLARGLPTFSIVGLPDVSVRESRDRVRSAFKNAGFAFPEGRVTVNLAPAKVRKEGPGYDLPIALGILAGADILPRERAGEVVCAGELALDGTLRPIHGTLAMGMAAAAEGFALMIPADNMGEALMVEGLVVYPVRTLLDAVAVWRGEAEGLRVVGNPDQHTEVNFADDVDFSDVKGQEHAKRALEIAAAGGHNALLMGSPGAGKTLLAKRVPTILPELTLLEALEVLRIHSVVGLNRGEGLQLQRPFRSPHHTISDVALVGGGSHPRPGEVSLAHHGVLFLDEFPEFHKNALETLRQPLEDGQVTVARSAGTLTFPAQFTLIAAMNPCPCGYYGDPLHACQCLSGQILKYRRKLSGPLLDRIDLHVEVPPLRFQEFVGGAQGERSSVIRARVRKARARQRRRYGAKGPSCNARLTTPQLRKWVPIDPGSERILQAAVTRMGLSARAIDRILKVARTIADLEAQETVQAHHVAEAVQYRTLDRVA